MAIVKKNALWPITLVFAVVLLCLSRGCYAFGEIDIVVNNNTNYEFTVWLEPKELFTFHLNPYDNITVHYSTEYFSYELLMHSQISSGVLNAVLISGYVEKSYRGKAIVDISVNTEGEVIYEVSDKIRFAL
jgi:hypothetical protein